MSRRRLSKSDVKELNERLARFSIELSKKDAVEVVDGAEGLQYVINGEVRLFERDGTVIPHLKLLLEKPTALKRVTVDMGAIRFVTNGADIMRPGIVAIEDGISAGDLVAVVDERHGKPLAVGEALLGSEEMRAATGGKAVKTLHYVGDKHWNAQQ